MRITEIVATAPQDRDFAKYDRIDYQRRTPFKPKYADDFKYVGKKGELTLWIDSFDPYTFIAYSGDDWAMAVNGKKTKIGMQIGTTTSNPKYRGHKMARTVYKMIAKKIGSLASDKLLSPAALSVWQSFDGDSQVELEVVNIHNKETKPADYDISDTNSYVYRILPH